MTKQLVLRLVAILVIFSSVAFYVISIKRLDSGAPPGEVFRHLLDFRFPSKHDLVPDGLSPLGGEKDIYSWQDAEGVWHFSTEQAPGLKAGVVEFDSGGNVDALEEPSHRGKPEMLKKTFGNAE